MRKVATCLRISSRPFPKTNFLRSGELKSENNDQKEVLALRAKVEDRNQKKDSNHNAKMNQIRMSQVNSATPRYVGDWSK